MYRLIRVSVPMLSLSLQINFYGAFMMHLLIAIDAGFLFLEYTFHYVAMVLRLLRRLYLVTGEDSHLDILPLFPKCTFNNKPIIFSLCD